jgi:hypothetical protein
VEIIHYVLNVFVFSSTENQGARRRGRPRKTCRRTIEEEITEMGKTWREVKAWQTRGEDGEASQEPYILPGTKEIKSSQYRQQSSPM